MHVAGSVFLDRTALYQGNPQHESVATLDGGEDWYRRFGQAFRSYTSEAAPSNGQHESVKRRVDQRTGHHMAS